MRSIWTGMLVMGLSLGCADATIRPPALPCPDGSSCSGGNPATSGGGTGGGTGGGIDAGVALDAGFSRYNLAGAVVLLDQIPPSATVHRAPVFGWAVRAVDDPLPSATTSADGAFTLTGVLPTVSAAGLPIIGVRAVATSRATFGVYRETRAGGGSVTLETFGAERVLEAVAGQGGAPAADLGHIAVFVTEASDPSVGVPNVVIDASSSSTSFYDNDGIPGQLTPSVAGTGHRGFALVLNVPAGDESNGSSVTLRVQSPTGTPTPGTVTVRVFPNTISWAAVRIVR